MIFRFRRGKYVGWSLAIALLLSVTLAPPVQAFCGFFVAKADANLENTTSQVVIAHSGDRSIFMMANDFQGDVKDFARIVPIPVIPSREQVRIGDGALMEKLSAFTAPRLAQYFDRPCQTEFEGYRVLVPAVLFVGTLIFLLVKVSAHSRGRLIVWMMTLIIVLILGAIALPSFLNQANKASAPAPIATVSDGTVAVEDQFTVGEYDVSILTATESDGLVRWLQQNDYQVGQDAVAMLQSYIETGMKFFVVRVNLAEFQKTGGQFLRPIILDYESDRLILPIRLGTLNATDDQDLLIHILSPDAYVETANYTTVPVPTDTESGDRWPSGHEVPAFVQNEFDPFYAAIFQQAHEQQGRNAVFLEYATRFASGNTANVASFNGTINGIKCDPCTVPIEERPTGSDLTAMGAWWLSEDVAQQSPQTFITRLHLRYNPTQFPEDLEFHSLSVEQLSQKKGIAGRWFPQRLGVDFQARYVIRRPIGSSICVSRFNYRRRMQQTADHLAALTGWSPEEIRQKMKVEQRLNALDGQGRTPLHRAIASHNLDRMRTLLDQGANVNLAQPNGLFSTTPLMAAIATNQPEAVRLLLAAGADANAKGVRGMSMLQWAIVHYQTQEVVHALLDAGADVSTPDPQGATALDYAQKVKEPSLQQLLQQFSQPSDR